MKNLVQAKFSELRKSFSITIRAKVVEVRLTWKMLKTEPSDLATFEILHQQAHTTLAGACTIFEFESISIFPITSNWHWIKLNPDAFRTIISSNC
jgi:hypothetical protein